MASSLLALGKGACFTVKPSQEELPAFGSCSITVTAYSDMWGIYSDQLTIKVLSTIVQCHLLMNNNGTASQSLHAAMFVYAITFLLCVF